MKIDALYAGAIAACLLLAHCDPARAQISPPPTSTIKVTLPNNQYMDISLSNLGTSQGWGGGGGAVSSVFGRTGAITAHAGDYSAGLITGLAASATTDTTNAGNITSGVLAQSQGGAGSVSGLLKGNGVGVVSQALAGTDYAAPPSGTSLLAGNGSGGLFNVTLLGLTYSAGTLSITGGPLGTAAFVNTGTSGSTIPLFSGTNTWSARQSVSLTGSGSVVYPVSVLNTASNANAAAGVFFDPGNQGVNVRGGYVNVSTNGSNQTTIHFGTANATTPADVLSIDFAGAPTVSNPSGWRSALALGTSATLNAGTTNGNVPTYSSGSWTPTMAYQTPGSGTFAYTTQTGDWIQIGKLAFVNFFVTFTPTLGTAAGRVSISTSGLPAALQTISAAGRIGCDLAFMSGGWTSLTNAFLGTVAGGTEINVETTTGAATTAAAVANLTGAAAHTVSGSCTYNVP